MGNIKFKNISFQFGGQSIFEDATICLKENNIHFLVGESGIGKTTLLNILSKRLSSDTVSNLHFWNNGKAGDIAKNLICYQLINHGYLQNLTVDENIKEVKKMCLSGNVDEKELIELFDFNPLLHQYPNQLSGGQKRLLSIILALLKDMPILFLDEPTSSLDEYVKIKLLNYLKKYARAGHTILLATNDFSIFSHADLLITIKNKNIHQINESQCEDSIISVTEHNRKISLKSVLKQHLWQKIILFCLVVSIGALYGNSVRTLSEANLFLENQRTYLGNTYLNTAYVYYETLLQSNDYHTFAPILNNEIKAQLEESNHIKTIYPYYVIPLGDLLSGKWAVENANMSLYLNNGEVIDLINENYPFLEFYYPEQINGDKIYISEQFLNIHSLHLEDVSKISIDSAIPVGAVEGDIVQLIEDENGKDIEIPIDSIKQVYKKEKLEFNIGDTHCTRGEMYNLSASPLLYAPYSMASELINTDEAVTNAFVLILEDSADIEQLRDEIYKIDGKLILSYPAQTNATYIAQGEEWYKDELIHHIGTTLLCIIIVSLFFVLLESLNKNDYYYLTYSGLSESNYLLYRLLSVFIVTISIIGFAFVYTIIFKSNKLSWAVLLLSHLSIALIIIGISCISLKLLFSLWNKK